MTSTKKIAALGASFAAATAAFMIGGAVTAPQAQAASCSAAVCMFQNINSGGSVLRGAYNVCGVYSNLQNQGFNDKISSIDNWVGYTQSFWTDANSKGNQLRIGGYIYVSNVGSLFNDKISSVVWTG